MAYNSRIADKVGFCIECSDGIQKPVISGRCKAYHYPRYLKQKAYQKANDRQQQIMAARKYSTDSDLQKWYEARKKEMTGTCCNCGRKSSKGTKYWKWSIAHIFGKAIFKSVATDENNWIELCMQCHAEFDSNLSTASGMQCFDMAGKKFKLFEHKISERHKYLELFKQYTQTKN